MALASGFFSSYVGGQISLKAHSHNCQTQLWGLFFETKYLSRDFWGRKSVPINPDGSRNNSILKTACDAWVAPGAIWQGSTTGLWLGLILGAFVSGLATRKSEEKAITSSNTPEDFSRQNLVAALCADGLELTPAQKEVLRRLLVLLIVKIGISSDNPESETETLSLEELQRLAAVASQHQLVKQNLTLAEIRRLLLK
jgi:hypothetical protein